MCFLLFLSWSDWCSAHGDLQSDRSACSLHDRWLHDVAQPFHHGNDLPISSGQSVHPCAVSTYQHLSVHSALATKDRQKFRIKSSQCDCCYDALLITNESEYVMKRRTTHRPILQVLCLSKVQGKQKSLHTFPYPRPHPHSTSPRPRLWFFNAQTCFGREVCCQLMTPLCCHNLFSVYIVVLRFARHSLQSSDTPRVDILHSVRISLGPSPTM